MKKFYIYVIIVTLFFSLVLGANGDPTKFGYLTNVSNPNSSVTTCYIGGSTGILNCTGHIYGLVFHGSGAGLTGLSSNVSNNYSIWSTYATYANYSQYANISNLQSLNYSTIINTKLTATATNCSVGNYSRFNGTGFECSPDTGGAGGGVSSIATTNPINGGTITTTGTITFNETWANTRYNDTGYCDAGLLLKLNVTDQRYNDTAYINSRAGGHSGIFISYTPITTTGNITNGTLNGYKAANNICNIFFNGTHMCSISEILDSINSNISNQNFTATFRVTQGAPGYLASANDCEGLTTAVGTSLGGIWVGSTSHVNTYGAGALVACNADRAIGCCR